MNEAVPRRRIWIYLLLVLIGVISYVDRITISVGARPIAQEFGL
jgi:hypothetical protein